MLRFARTSRPWFVMAGRGDEASLRADVPAIHVLGAASKCVDTRHKAGHDGVEKRCVTYGVCVRILREVGTPVSKRRHGRARRRSFASRGRPGRGSSWPGLSRPSTFLVPRASAWIPGTRPGMTVLRAL